MDGLKVSVVEGEDGELIQLYDPKQSLSVVQLRKDLKRLRTLPIIYHIFDLFGVFVIMFNQ